MIKPPRLNPGDRLAAISLSWGGAAEHPHRYAAGKRELEAEFGVTVVETRHALRSPEWLRRNPEARAEDLMEAFADPAIAGIVSIIGGDDSIRLLPWIDPEVIRSHPKVFLGYSDSTVTHWACHAAGLVTFYGPSIMSGFAENGGMLPYMVRSVRQTLFSAEPIGVVEPNRDGWTAEFLEWSDPANQDRKRALTPAGGPLFLQGEGVAEGRLFGGCLEVVEFLRGTPAWPDPGTWREAILFLETSEEAPPPRTLERALRSYGAMGILEQISGILLGRPGGGVPQESFGEYDRAILRVVAEEHGLTRLPIVTRMDFGHTDPMFVLPLGVRARIDCGSRRFEIVESGVV
jgi:muramoyltetrapeptide carboxypeptidase LdcA involved in peptidoglycan recycling